MSADIIDFNEYNKCKMCANLQRVDKCTYLCTVWEDDAGCDIYPIENDKQTSSYYMCDGTEFIRKRGKRSGQRNSI